MPAARAFAAASAAADGPQAPKEGGKAKPGALGAASDLSGRVTPCEGQPVSGETASAASQQFFDQASAAAGAAAVPAGIDGAPLHRL